MADREQHGTWNERTGETCPHGVDTGGYCPRCDQEISEGMGLQWETGTLSTRTLERVLTDALADLYGSAFRRGENVRDRNTRFLGDLKRCVQHATGVDLISLTPTRTERR